MKEPLSGLKSPSLRPTALALPMLFSACLSTTIKETAVLEYPIAREVESGDSGVSAGTGDNFRDTYDAKARLPVLFIPTPREVPVIDGVFGDWSGVPGIETEVDVLGGRYDEKDAHAAMAVSTDGRLVWFYLRVDDDEVEDNRLSADQAYLGDSIDIFFSLRPSGLRRAPGDAERQIRVIPRRDSEFENALITLNGREYRHIIPHRLVYSETGFSVEFAVPLLLLSEKRDMRPGRKLQVSLQYNDSDGKGRDRILHWVNPEDSSWRDFSSWGRGEVLSPDRNAQEARSTRNAKEQERVR